MTQPIEYPPGVALVRVQGTFLKPDFTPHSGRIEFGAPWDLVLDPTGDALYAGTVTAYLDDDGKIDVTLVASDSPLINPTGWTYRISGSLSGVAIEPRYFPLWASKPEVDLVQMMPVDFTPGSTAPVLLTLQGPPGPSGQPRYTGSGAPGLIIGAAPGDKYLDLASGKIYQLT